MANTVDENMALFVGGNHRGADSPSAKVNPQLAAIDEMPCGGNDLTIKPELDAGADIGRIDDFFDFAGTQADLASRHAIDPPAVAGVPGRVGIVAGNGFGPMMATFVLAGSNLLTLYGLIAAATVGSVLAFLATSAPKPSRS